MATSIFCVFEQHAGCNVYECCVCHRMIDAVTVREYSERVIVQLCGVASRYDRQQRPCTMQPQCFINERKPYDRTNELIGQEGGRFDAMYMEGAEHGH